MNDQTDMNSGFLKEKLGNYQVHPPEKVWNEISGKIGGARNRKGMFLVMLVSAASLALAITLGIHYFGPDLPRQGSLSEESPLEEGASSVKRDGDPVRPVEPAMREQMVSEILATLPEESALSSEDGAQIGEDQVAIAMNSKEPVEDELTIEPVVERVAETDRSTVAEPAIDPLIKLEPDASANLQSDPFPMMEQDQKRDPRWMLGAVISPLYSFRDAEASAVPDNPAESGTISYSTGVQVSYRRNSRFAIETGIYFNKTGIAIGAPGIQVFSQRQDDMIFNAGSEKADIKTVSNTVGNIIAYSGDIYMNGYKITAENNANPFPDVPMTDVQAAESGIQQHLDYLELPLNLRYSVIDRTFELQLVGGMSTNFLVDNYVTMETSSGQEEIGYLSNVNTVNYSGNAGVGMIYHMGANLSLSLEPRFRYFLNSVNDSSLPSTRPYSLGLYTGLSYTF